MKIDFRYCLLCCYIVEIFTSSMHSYITFTRKQDFNLLKKKKAINEKTSLLLKV